MHRNYRFYLKATVFFFSCLTQSLFAAQRVDLYYHPTISSLTAATLMNASQMGEDQIIRKSYSKNGLTHLHLRQMYKGVPVWGGEYVLHTSIYPSTAQKQKFLINGIKYQGLEADLVNTPNSIFTSQQMQSAISSTMKANSLQTAYQRSPKAKLIIFVDKDKVAHYAFLLQFSLHKKTPTYIIDALTFKVYKQWDNYQTFETVIAGGLGGNRTVGQLSYDGQINHLPTFNIARDPILHICYMRDDNAVLKDTRSHLDDVQFACETKNASHGNLYWNGQLDSAGNGYSPSNDTLYAADIVTNMYKDWFNLPVWTDQYGKPTKMVFFMHDPDANASFTEDGYIIVGDATQTDDFFPFTSLDVIAHEMGHAVTYQNANLWYNQQSGGLNESFSDMSGKAAEFYVRGTIKDWSVGRDIMTNPDSALRYMDQPSKDCTEGQQPGDNCSIDNVSQISDDTDVHYTSGIYNRVFYLLATTPNWDVKKAYQLMLHANQHYWTNFSDFCQASRGVWLAAQELGYNETDVIAAFAPVGIDPKTCS